ncbi:MAG: hypothetical protein JSS27_02315 [Planctomycetes bacterium]|nr:hypothetical protein [Planctomycetota bacterium]
MNRMKNLVRFLVLCGGLLLVACDSSYQEKLNEMLRGKTVAEKRLILADECAAQINNGSTPKARGNASHYERMKHICEEMTGETVDANPPVQLHK